MPKRCQATRFKIITKTSGVKTANRLPPDTVGLSPQLPAKSLSLFARESFQLILRQRSHLLVGQGA